MPIFRPPVQEPLRAFGTAPMVGEFVVTRPFGDMTFPQYGAHDGLDIDNGGPAGDPILAIADGIVTRALFDPASGGAGIVRIDHGGGWSSGYAHLGWIYVSVAETVMQGQVIGLLGSTGWVTGPHLHFDISLNNVRQDPWPLLTQPTGNEEEPMYNPRDLIAQYGQKLRTRAGVNVRAKQGTSYPVLAVLKEGTTLIAAARVVGEPANGSIEWYEVKVELNGQVQTGYVHSSAVEVEAEPEPDPLSYANGYAAARANAVDVVSKI